MIQTVQRRAIGNSHGKLILVGEHSVVYDMPAIAIPFPLLEVISTVEESFEDIMIDSDYFKGPIDLAPKKLQGITTCIYETLKYLNKPGEGLLIRLNSSIPIGRGLGSSAAIAIAIVKSLFAYYGQKAKSSELRSLVHIAETHAHGNPSGIDMAAAFSPFPIWFQKGQTETLQIGGPLFLVVADTGHFADTRSAVSSVKEKLIADPEKIQKLLCQLGAITHEAKEAIYDGDLILLGTLFNLAQLKLIELGVSNEDINRLVNAARAAGALGAKLTGAGRGGCILALAHNLQHAKVIAKSLMKAGAYNTWCFSVNSTS